MQRTSEGAAYFERPLPIVLTFAAFFLVVVPLVYLRCVPNDYAVLPYLLIAEAVGLGTSHFFITLAVYLQPANLAFFASSWQRRCVYYGLPIAIFLAVALSEGLRTRERFPGFAFYFYAGVRFFDFFHVGRQSVGMLQLFKRPLHAELPRWTRQADNAFFVGVALLQWQTFLLGGEFQAQRLSMWLPALLLGVLFVALVAVYLEAVLDAETRKPAAIALAYFVVQAACAATAAYATWLYLTVLAVHYVEYHVIMAPRLVGPKAKPSLVRSPVLLYGGLVALVVLFEARNYVITDSLPLGFLVHIFDGIFLFHYVLDAFLWKFNNPYYRSVLAPLYFEPKPERARLRPGFALALCGLGALGTLAAVSGGWGPHGKLYAATLAPLYAEEHLRWAVSLVRDGDLSSAQHHLELASELAPSDQRPKGLLRMVSQQLEQVKHEQP